MPEQDDLKRNRKIYAALNKALEDGPWDKSLFLRATGDKLRKLRDRFKAAVKLESSEQQIAAGFMGQKMRAGAGQLDVYVTLYSSAGSELKSWEKLLGNLKSVLITRPILAREEDAKELIRAKANKKNEAYFAAYINKSDVMPPIGGKTPRDALGHELLVLKDGAVEAKNITYFMHISGKYELKDGRLVRQSDSAF